MVDSDFFPQIFMIFCTFSSFSVKLLFLEPCDFFTFLFIRLFKVRVSQVNPG